MRSWVLMAGLVFPVAASAQPTDIDANLNVLLTNPSYVGCSDPEFVQIDERVCSEIASGPIAGPAFLWLVTSREGGYDAGIGGVQLGLTHTLGSGLAWALCTGGSEIPEPGWPDSGTGDAATWAGGCYHPAGQVARIGYLGLSLGDVGSIAITGDPRIGEAVYADCLAELFSYCDGNLGRAELAEGTTPLCGDYCEVVPVHDVSWGAIKSLY